MLGDRPRQLVAFVITAYELDEFHQRMRSGHSDFLLLNTNAGAYLRCYSTGGRCGRRVGAEAVDHLQMLPESKLLSPCSPARQFLETAACRMKHLQTE